MRATQALRLATGFPTTVPMSRRSSHNGWTFPCPTISLEKVDRLSILQFPSKETVNVTIILIKTGNEWE